MANIIPDMSWMICEVVTVGDAGWWNMQKRIFFRWLPAWQVAVGELVCRQTACPGKWPALPTDWIVPGGRL